LTPICPSRRSISSPRPARPRLRHCLPKPPSGIYGCLWHQNCFSHCVVSLREDVTKMFSLDPLDFVWLAPGFALALWAQWRRQQACRQGKAVVPTRRITGAQAAAEVLQFAGITGVAIEPGKGILTDHYDTRYSVLRLRPHVYYGQSLTALGLAAHEAGQAREEAMGYPLLGLRNGLVPLASFGSHVSWLLILAGGKLVALQAPRGEP